MKIAHISIYPQKGQTHTGGSGVAAYTKNLLTHMPRPAMHHVICDRPGPAAYQDNNIHVYRVFDRNPRFIRQVNAQLKQLRPDVVHIQQELALFGGLMTAYLLPLLMVLWRSRIALTLHGVVSLTGVNKQFVSANNYSPIPVWAVRTGLWLLYTLLAGQSRWVIVHEPYFKRVLVKEYGIRSSKVIVIPHGIEDLQPLPTQHARQQLNLRPGQKVVLFMGYAAGYKGIDLLLEGFAAFAKSNPDAFLLMGAGLHPKLKDDPGHQVTYKAWQQKARRLIGHNQYRWVGYIPEDKIALYYSAADVSVYPYQLAIASSGPMAFAIGFNKPFLASTAFSHTFDERLIFTSTPQGLAQKLHDFFTAPHIFAHTVRALRQDRLWAKVSQQTARVYQGE